MPETDGRRSHTQTALLVAGAMIIASLILFMLSATVDGHSAVAVVLQQVAGTLLVAGVLSVAYEIWGRRALLKEVMEVANLSSDVRSSGINRIGDSHTQIPWADLYQANHVEVYLALGRTWFSHNSADLTALVARPGSRLTVILADPEDEDAMNCMAKRFGRSAEDVKSGIQVTVQMLSALAEKAHGEVKVYLRNGEPLHAIYRFDSTAVVTFYSHRREHGKVPYIICRGGGSIYDFLREELGRVQDQGRLVVHVGGAS